MPITDQGIDTNRYMLIPRTLIFVTSQAKILLIKGSPQKRLWANRYNGIGGHIEQGESVHQAAVRELKEETGLEADLELAGTVIINSTKNPGIILFVFVGETDERPTITTAEGKAEWISLDALAQIPLVEDLPILLPAVQTTRQTGKMFSALYFYDQEGRLSIQFSG